MLTGWMVDEIYLLKLEGVGYFAWQAYVGWVDGGWLADIGFCCEDRRPLQSLGGWGLSDIQAQTCDECAECMKISKNTFGQFVFDLAVDFSKPSRRWFCSVSKMLDIETAAAGSD